MVDGFLSLDKAQTEFQRETGKTINHLDTINTSLISSTDYIKQASALTKELGMNAQAIFTKDTLQEAAELTTLIGLSADESNRLAILSKVSGKELLQVDKNIVKIVDHFNKTNRTAISAKGVLQDVAKVSNAIAVTFANNPEKIAAAVTQAKALGLTLEAVNASADSLLNFESSINNEISAELITGQQLNLEKARLYALNDDIASLTKEIGTNEGVINGFTKGNRIQREAIAAAIGVSKEDLAKMVMTQKISEGLSGQALADATGMSLEDMKRLTIQESITKSIEKMGEALAGPLEFLAQMVQLLSQFKLLGIAIAGLVAGAMINSFAKLITSLKIIRSLEIGSAIAAAWKSAFSSPASMLTGGLVGLAMGAGLTAAIMSSMSNAKTGDDIASQGYGKRTLFDGKDTIRLNDNDTVIAGTSLFGGNNRGSQQSRQDVFAGQQDAFIREMRAIGQDIAQSNKKPLYVEAVVGTPSIVRGLRNQPKV
jgi:hypothetical protein